jgi:hypothetical protein
VFLAATKNASVEVGRNTEIAADSSSGSPDTSAGVHAQSGRSRFPWVC